MKLTATYKGLITGLIMIAASVFFFYGLHLPVKGYSNYVIMAIFVVGILWSLISLKMKTGDVDKTVKQYFSEGFKTFIVMTLLIVVYTIIFYKLNPQILETMLKENAEIAAKEGTRTPMEIENNTIKLRSIFTTMTMATTTILYLLLGSVVSLLGGAVLSQSNKS